LHIGRQQRDRHRGEFLAQLLGGGDAAHAGHVDIHQDQVRRHVARLEQGFLAGAGFLDDPVGVQPAMYCRAIMRETRLSSTIKMVLGVVMSHPRRWFLLILAYPARLAASLCKSAAPQCYVLSQRNFGRKARW
jgi:hypothetical protein